MAVSQRKQSGFTLIEVLVATTILSLMMIGVIQITDNSIDSTENIVTEDNQRYQLQSALMRFERDFRLLYSPLYYSQKWQPKKKSGQENTNNAQAGYGNNSEDQVNPSDRLARHPRFAYVSTEEQPVPKFIFENKDNISFLSTSNLLYNPNQKQSRLNWVQYYITEMDDLSDEDKTNELGQYRLMRKSNATDIYSKTDNIFTDKKGFEILDHIVELHFKVWDSKTEKFVDSIREIHSKEEQLAIKAIRMDLVWKPFVNEEIKISKIFTPLWPTFDAKEKDKIEVNPKSQKGGTSP